MNEQLARVVGQQLRLRRTAARKTKTVVAGLAGITPDYLYQIERGLKLPTLTVLLALSEVLGVAVGDLFGPTQTATPRAEQNATAGDVLYRALTGPVQNEDGAPPVSELRGDISRAWHSWQTSPYRYTDLTACLPALITDTELALRTGDDARAAHGCAADLYGLVRTVAKRCGRVDLSLLAADRAIRAAEAADDPLRLAAARWNLTQVLLADGEVEGAEAVATHAGEALRPQVSTGNLDALALSGALLLIAAITAARQGNGWIARERLQAAAPLAARTGERNTLWTVFGPTNLAMYAVSVEVETGEAAEGLRLAEHIAHDQSPSIERRVAFLLDQAKGHQQRRDYASALLLLHTAEREAPEDLRHRPSAQAIVRDVVLRGRRSVAAEAAQLAARVGLTVG